MPPVRLPSLDTSSQPLRFLDYLIYQEREAAVLYGSGVLVNVPDPARYAWHKLIVSQRQVVAGEKVREDVAQAGMLFDALAATGEGRGDLRDRWDALAEPGRVRWQEIARSALVQLPKAQHDRIMAVIGSQQSAKFNT